MNSLHASLKFTLELSGSDGLSFLDIEVSTSSYRTLKISWYRKKTDTNVYMNFLSLAPQSYKAAIVQGLVHRLSSISSSWEQFHSDFSTAKGIFEANQYPPSFYNPLVHWALNNVMDKEHKKSNGSKNN